MKGTIYQTIRVIVKFEGWPQDEKDVVLSRDIWAGENLRTFEAIQDRISNVLVDDGFRVSSVTCEYTSFVSEEQQAIVDAVTLLTKNGYSVTRQ